MGEPARKGPRAALQFSNSNFVSFLPKLFLLKLGAVTFSQANPDYSIDFYLKIKHMVL